MRIRETIKRVLKEEIDLPLFLKRRMNITKDKIVNHLRQFAMGAWDPYKRMEEIVGRACNDTAYEILDSTHMAVDDETYYEIEARLTKYLRDKYEEEIKEFIQQQFSESGNEKDNVYTFWKHAERNGGNGFKDSFSIWNGLLKKYGGWFPNLDWNYLKDTLDLMPDNKPLLIAEPGDEYNTMGYYFSLIKFKRNDTSINQMESREKIRKVLKEGVKERIIELIDSHGLESAISFVGGWEELKNIVGEEYITTKHMIDYIKEVARKNDGISVYDFDEDPIFYEETKSEYREIRYFGFVRVTVQRWYKETFDDLGDLHIFYEKLSDDVIKRIFEFLIDKNI